MLTKQQQTKIFKRRIWSFSYADYVFAQDIKMRDGRCRRCWRDDLPFECSHFHGRGISSTRYDEKNCITLCPNCHAIFESKKKSTYRQFMLTWLGKEEFGALERRARINMPRRDAIINLMNSHANSHRLPDIR